jgi:RNA polymerase sigma-70 factor (ECF subfamily)
MAEDDAELVRRIADSGEAAREAERRLCRRYGPRALLYGLRHLREADQARELAQSVLLAVLLAVRNRRVAEPEHLDRFVLGTCRHLAARMREHVARATPTELAELDVAVEVPEPVTVDLPALTRCLAALDARARLVVQLSFYEERSAEEIAERLGTTAGNARVLRHRAVARLRRCLDGGAGESR